jgi:hypothetical protein
MPGDEASDGARYFRSLGMNLAVAGGEAIAMRKIPKSLSLATSDAVSVLRRTHIGYPWPPWDNQLPACSSAFVAAQVRCQATPDES